MSAPNLAQLPPAPDPDPHAVSRIDWHTLWDPEPGGDWLIGPIIPRGRGTAIYAPQKGGKSLFVAGIVTPAVVGRAVLDRPAGEPLRVLYLDYEMTGEDVADRLADMGYGPGDADRLEPFAYHVMPNLPPLDMEAGGDEILAMAQAHRADLVVIDTMARAVKGEENNADTYRNYYRCTGAPLKAAGIATTRLDHSGKDADKGQRGSSAKADDVDVVWRLTPRDGGRFTMKATHRRMAWVPEMVELERTTDPLTYRRVIGSWPAGTGETADLLDHLDVPIDASRRVAVTALRNAGHGKRAEVVAAAQRFRNSNERAQVVAP